MTRGWKSHTSVELLAALAFIGGLLVAESEAAPPATPTGTIFYSSGSTFYAVKPDGTGLTQALPASFAALNPGWVAAAEPSQRPYGGNAIHDRWWITLLQNGTYDEVLSYTGIITDYPHYDLFAVRSNPQNRSQMVVVQLTDLYGIVNFTPQTACWSNNSNEGTDSFVAAFARDIRGSFVEDEDGTTSFDNLAAISHTLRLPVSGSEINSGWLANNFAPVSPDTITEEELDEMLLANQGNVTRFDTQGITSPTGDEYLGSGSKLTIRDAFTPGPNNILQVLWDGSTVAPKSMLQCQWSPDGLTVAIEERASTQPGGSDIWTQPASGATAPKRILASTVVGTKTSTYGVPMWSPDSKYLVVLKRQYTGSTLTAAWITRLNVADGKTLDLATVTVAAGVGSLTRRWVPNN